MVTSLRVSRVDAGEVEVSAVAHSEQNLALGPFAAPHRGHWTTTPAGSVMWVTGSVGLLRVDLLSPTAGLSDILRAMVWPSHPQVRTSGA